MVERVLEQQQPLCAALLVLKKGDLLPTYTEFAVMETYIFLVALLFVVDPYFLFIILVCLTSKSSLPDV